MDEDRTILVRAAGEGWTAPRVQAYDDEAHLQRLLAAEPGWIPGVADDALTALELTTAGGPIDVCVVGRDGALTVVECKLASNSEKRRMVVGQVIDYAAAIWAAQPDGFIEAWHRRTGVDLRTTLEDASLRMLQRNISEARIDLCLAVDAIDAELRRLVEFLNQATRADVRVTALQLSYARHGDVEILIPSTYGGELADAKARSSGGGRDRWTRNTFIEAIARADDRVLAAEVFGLLDGLEARGPKEAIVFGQNPGGGVYLHPYGLEHAPAWLSVNSRGELMVCGTWKSYQLVANHSAYAELAGLLGQSHLQGAKGVPLAGLSLDELWPVLCESAVRLGEAARAAKETGQV